MPFFQSAQAVTRKILRQSGYYFKILFLTVLETGKSKPKMQSDPVSIKKLFPNIYSGHHMTDSRESACAILGIVISAYALQGGVGQP